MGDLADSVAVYRCPVCGFPSACSDTMRNHVSTTRDDDGDLHDGDPWEVDVVTLGESVIWEPHKPHAWERVRALRIEMRGGEWWVLSTGSRAGRAWNTIERWVEATRPWGDRG